MSFEKNFINVKKELELRTVGAPVGVSWSPDGSALTAASQFGTVITVWDSSGRKINQFQRIGGGPALFGSIDFMDGAKKVVFLPPKKTPSDVALTIWDVSNGTAVKNILGSSQGGDYSRNRSGHFVVSNDQSLIVAGANVGGNVAIYRPPDPHPVHVIKIPDGIFSLSIFDSNKLAAIGSNLGNISVVDLNTGQLVRTLKAFDDSIFGALFIGAVAGSPDGKTLFAGVGQVNLNASGVRLSAGAEWEKSMSEVRILRTQDGQVIASLNVPLTPIRQAAWDPRGRFVAFLDNASFLFLWDMQNQEGQYMKITLPSQALSLSIRNDGNKIAVATNAGIIIFSVELK